mgnify:CR=1 FL=1
MSDDNNDIKKVGKNPKFRTDTIQYQKKIEEVAQYIVEGLRSNEIYATLLVEDNSLTENRFKKLLQRAYAFAFSSLHKDREYIFELHMDRYEDLYNKSMYMFNDRYQTPLDPKKEWHLIVSRYVNEMKALKAKEDLIGLHDKSMVIEVNQGKAVVIEHDNREEKSIAGYDLDALTDQEQIELLALIKDIRVVPIEGVQKVTIKRTVIEINTETLQREQRQETINIGHVEVREFEDMPDDVVSKFENTLPVEEVKEPETGIILQDDVPKDIGKKDLRQIQESINSTALDEFKKRLAERKNK